MAVAYIPTIVLICALCLVASQAHSIRGTKRPNVDYCDTMLCDGHKQHIGCGHLGDMSLSCPEDANMVEFDDKLKQLLVDMHNEKRNIVAGGKVKHLNAACRMATIAWDDELAALAELNVKQCRSRHDLCHNTRQFRFSGQNLGWEGSAMPFLDADMPNLMQEIVDMWYDEVSRTTQSQIDKYPDNYHEPPIGHFTVMVNELNVRLGCAAIRYGGYYHNFLIACNYAATNIIDEASYQSCERPGEGCDSGLNHDYGNLCSKDERIDPNDWQYASTAHGRTDSRTYAPTADHTMRCGGEVFR